MSFPYKNAHSLSQAFWDYKEAGPTSTILVLPVGMYNMAQLPGVVDVSAMEFSFSLDQTSITGTPARFIGTLATTAVFVMADGGPTGDATAQAVLFAGSSDAAVWSSSIADGGLGNSVSPNQPLDAQGTSTTDLDADDWLNFRVVQNATGLVGLVIINANYIYGKPAAIA